MIFTISDAKLNTIPNTPDTRYLRRTFLQYACNVLRIIKFADLQRTFVPLLKLFADLWRRGGGTIPVREAITSLTPPIGTALPPDRLVSRRYRTMPSVSTFLLSRVLPIVIMVVITYIVPYVQRTYLITGLSGKNFQQTDVSQCDVVHRDTLIGCEDLHVYDAPSGPMIFAGCVDKISDQFVAPVREVGGLRE